MTPAPRAAAASGIEVSLSTRAVPRASAGHDVDCRGRAPTAEGEATAPKRRSALSWAALLARTYDVDALACGRAGCGGRMRVVASITSKSVIQRILDHLGLPAELPRFARARGPPDAAGDA